MIERYRMTTMGRFGVVLIVIGLLSAVAEAQRAHCPHFATPAEAQAMSEKAAEHLARVGLDRAFGDFMNTGGPFFDRDLYVFVLDMNGRVVLNGRFPEVAGSGGLDLFDGSGPSFAGNAVAIGRGPGRGWIEYQWYNPCTGEYGYKSSYIIRVGDYLVGVGAYGSVSA